MNPNSQFKLKKKSNDIKVIVGKPERLNPNIFKNLPVILVSLGQRAKIAKYSPLISEAESRKCIFIGNYWGILNPVLKLIFNVYCCLDCNEAIYGQENFESHLCSSAILNFIGLFDKQFYFILKRMLQNRLLTFVGNL